MAQGNRWYSSPTQIYWTCKALLEGREISHKTEIREVKGWRLAAICHKLKKRYGWPIETSSRGPQNITYYKLANGADLTKLRFPPSARSLGEDGGHG